MYACVYVHIYIYIYASIFIFVFYVFIVHIKTDRKGLGVKGFRCFSRFTFLVLRV